MAKFITVTVLIGTGITKALNKLKKAIIDADRIVMAHETDYENENYTMVYLTDNIDGDGILISENLDELEWLINECT